MTALMMAQLGSDGWLSRLPVIGAIQSSGPLRYAIVDGMNLRDSRFHKYPPRWNAAPSQDPSGHPTQPTDRRGLVGAAALGSDPILVQGPGRRPKADQRQMRDRGEGGRRKKPATGARRALPLSPAGGAGAR